MKIFGGILVLAVVYAVLTFLFDSVGLLPEISDEEADYIESTQMMIR